MINKLFTYIFTLLVINSVFLSCTQPIDFDQISDFEIAPVIETSLAYLNQTAPSFLDNGNEIVSLQDYIQVDFLNDNFFVDDLVKAEFVFETENSINRAFEVKVDFLDADSQIQHTFSFLVEASTNNSNVISNYTEVFQGDSLLALKNTSFLIFTLNILPGTPINKNTPGRIILKSKSIFNFHIGPSV